MYFSKITLKSQVNIADYINSMTQDSYKEHQQLWQLFNQDPNAKRDFLYRYEAQQGRPAYYIVSKRQPIDKQNFWNIQTKPYDPLLKAQQRFAFILRANPVVARDKKRHDIVMNEKYRIGYQSLPQDKRPSMRELIEKTGFEWLNQRAKDNGFEITQEALQIDGYLAHHIKKKPKTKGIRYNSMDFSGHLRVTEPEKFKSLLMDGMGKSKAFGCGLLLIRRIV